MRIRIGGWGRGHAFALVVGVLLAAVSLWLAGAEPASAQSNQDAQLQVEKEKWQEKYRSLLRDAAQLRIEIEEQSELYADANRRNYRRGDKRHIHAEARDEAKKKLAIVEGELATIQDDGRRAGALPGWFYEVEAEFEAEQLASPAASDLDDDSAEDGREGRNPLYLEDDEDQ